MDIKLFRNFLASNSDKKHLIAESNKPAFNLTESATPTFNYGGNGTPNREGAKTADKTKVRIKTIRFQKYIPASKSEIWVYFNPTDWNTSKDGLLCGDEEFLKNLQSYLKGKGFPNTEDIKWGNCKDQGRDWALFISGSKLITWYFQNFNTEVL